MINVGGQLHAEISTAVQSLQFTCILSSPTFIQSADVFWL